MASTSDNKKNILVTGGAGYIGSHTVLSLLEHGYNVVIIDDLSTGNRSLVPKDAVLVLGDIADEMVLETIFSQHDIFAVIHFAASIIVTESVMNPLLYYRNNFTNSMTLLKTCIDHDIKRFIFSSTAAVYGNPEKSPASEADTTLPINPYGKSKLMFEQVLEDVHEAHGLQYAVLRYFNVAGADAAGRSGQLSKNSTHLIKTAAELAVGKRRKMHVYGTDYPTEDGTCIRDYIHVTDLAEAHVATLEYMLASNNNPVLNCGYGHGFSVRQVLNVVEELVGKKLNVQESKRRPGDPAELVAAVDKIRKTLAWKPKYNDLKEIIRTAIEWEKNH